MNKRSTKPNITGPAALLVFTVFALCLLSVLLTGARIYQRLHLRSEESWQQRTAAQYITTRLRQADRSGALSVESFGGEDALLLRREISGEMYETYIYCSGGYIRELFAAAGSGLAPEDGERILPARAMNFTRTDHALEAVITHADGSRQHLQLWLRSGEEGTP